MKAKVTFFHKNIITDQLTITFIPVTTVMLVRGSDCNNFEPNENLVTMLNICQPLTELNLCHLNIHLMEIYLYIYIICLLEMAYIL